MKRATRKVTVEIGVDDINFVYYADDQIYVQFDPIPLGPSDEHGEIVLELLNEALAGKATANEITSDDGYYQASIAEQLTFDQLCQLGYPVSDER